MLLFFIGSIVIASSHDFTTILVGRTVQGAGGGGILCLTALTVVDTVPLRERGKWFSLLGVMWSLGTITGPLLG
jgi:MFS family permease